MYSNANSSHSKGIQSIRMQILNHSKGIRSICIQIGITRKGFEAFECKFEQFERDLKRIHCIRIQIRTIRKRLRKQIGSIQKGFEALEGKH